MIIDLVTISTFLASIWYFSPFPGIYPLCVNYQIYFHIISKNTLLLFSFLSFCIFMCIFLIINLGRNLSLFLWRRAFNFIHLSFSVVVVSLCITNLSFHFDYILLSHILRFALLLLFLLTELKIEFYSIVDSIVTPLNSTLSFLRNVFNTISFPLSTNLAVPHILTCHASTVPKF